MTEIDVSNCTYYVEGECDIYQDNCAKVECQYKWYKRIEAENAKLKETLKSVRGYFIVLENIIPTKMLAEGSGVFGAINDAKKEIDEVLKDE